MSLVQLFIRELTHNITSTYKLLSRKEPTQSHFIQVHWGGRYSIRVRMAVDDAVLSEPVLCNGPVIQAPFELTYNYINGSFFWRDNPGLPKEIKSGK